MGPYYRASELSQRDTSPPLVSVCMRRLVRDTTTRIVTHDVSLSSLAVSGTHESRTGTLFGFCDPETAASLRSYYI